MGALKRVAQGVGLAGALCVGVVGVRTASSPAALGTVEPSTLAVDTADVADKLSEALRFATLAQPSLRDDETFSAFQGWMAETWPSLHAVAPREQLGRQALLYTWSGSDPSLPPVVVLAHQDVVPVESGTEDGWSHPPFSGAIAPCGDVPGDCVWGRGAMDMKAPLVGLFEAADQLASAGWQPRRTLLFALGDDEEVSGSGARAIAAHLERQGVRPAWVLDEGLAVTDGIVPGLDRPAALVGIAEKGFVSVEIVARSGGGHSSMPPRSTAAGRVSRAVARLEAEPFETGLDGPAGHMFGALGPHMGLLNRAVFANLWLFGPLVERQLSASDTTRATLHTTQAATMLEGSPQDNVLPQRARAVVNYRIHPRDSVQGVLAHMEAAIDDPEVELRPLPDSLYSEPSPVSSPDGAGFAAVRRAIGAAIPEAVVAPGLVLGATDARAFGHLSDQVLRFQPLWLRPGDASRIHGTGERVAVEGLRHFVRFHHAHLVEAGGAPAP